MVYQSVQKYESGFETAMTRRVEGGFTIHLNNEDDVEVLAMTVEATDTPPVDIAEAMEVAYRAGRDDGRHEMRQRIKEAIEKAWKGATYGP